MLKSERAIGTQDLISGASRGVLCFVSCALAFGGVSAQPKPLITAQAPGACRSSFGHARALGPCGGGSGGSLHSGAHRPGSATHGSVHSTDKSSERALLPGVHPRCVTPNGFAFLNEVQEGLAASALPLAAGASTVRTFSTHSPQFSIHTGTVRAAYQGHPKGKPHEL